MNRVEVSRIECACARARLLLSVATCA